MVFVEYPSGSPTSNEVDLRFEWPHTPYTTGKVLIIIRNGSLKMTGSAIGNSQGAIYCPDGEVRPMVVEMENSRVRLGQGGATNIGNFNFVMTPAFLNDPPFFAWTVMRETAWTEVDR